MGSYLYFLSLNCLLIISGIYSCTSAGSFLFTALETASGRLTEGTSKKIELPEPLMAVAFEPLSNPKYFAYGGEEVPLSVWEISKALSTPPSSPEPEEEDESNEGGSSQLSGKQRKRKRAAEKRSKEKDLKWGEIWRARNVRKLSMRGSCFSAKLIITIS